MVYMVMVVMSMSGAVSECGLDVLKPYCVFFYKEKTAYEVRISDLSSDVCSSDLKGNSPASRPWFQPSASDSRPTAMLMFQIQHTTAPIFGHTTRKIGRASCRERVCQYV